MPLPTTETLLLGPGPSPVAQNVLAALGAPPRSHLDPEFLALLDDLRGSLTRLFRAPHGSLTLAVSGTGTSGMEAVVANLVEPGKRALVVVSGYFGDRLAQMIARYGGDVERLDVEWGRAVDPAAVASALGQRRADIVAVVHGETSTGVCNPVREVAAVARDHDALTIVDAVTTLGAVPVDLDAWQADAAYSCSQKGLGAPSGLAPVALAPRALDRRVRCRSFYLDLALLQDYWVGRKYHHTMSAPLVYALHTAIGDVEAEGLASRWARHDAVHAQFVGQLDALRLTLLPPPSERLVNLNAVTVPSGVDERAVRQTLLETHKIEIGAGLGPLAGRVWRVGLMGSGATADNVERVSRALRGAIHGG